MDSLTQVMKSTVLTFRGERVSRVAIPLLVGVVAGGLTFLVLHLLPHLAPVFQALHLDPLHRVLCYACSAGDAAPALGIGGGAAAGAGDPFAPKPIPRPPGGPKPPKPPPDKKKPDDFDKPKPPEKPDDGWKKDACNFFGWDGWPCK